LLVHTPLEQSLAPPHALPVAHLAQLVPPQSTSLSPPFLTLSEHVAAWHRPPVQTPLWQSEPPPHALPAAHLLVHEPPQSVSASLPFLTPSLHVAATHFLVVLEHTRLRQSADTPHTLLTSQPEQEPPQSTSVSVPFLTVSLQLGA
jgi:hypothetical protein